MRYKGPVLERVAEVEKFAFVLSFRRDLALLTTFVKGLEGGGCKRGELWDGLATGWCSEAEKQRAGGGADCWWALLEAPRGWLWLNHRNPGELLKGASVCQRKTVCFLLRFLFTSCLLCLFLLQLPAPCPCRRCADAASACWWCQAGQRQHTPCALTPVALSCSLSQPHGGLPGWPKVPAVQKVRMWKKTGDLFQDLDLQRLGVRHSSCVC